MSRHPLVALVAAACVAACSDGPAAPEPIAASVAGVPAPAGVVPVAITGGTLSLWPYTGTDFTGTGQDPINVIITGAADQRAIRAALMGLDGNRTAFGFPPVAPFDCIWEDAIGGSQTAFSDGAGWTGSAIQLQCGEYGPIRFHIRLFDAGASTLVGAHFEILIPGTTDHQVLSWEIAEQLVVADLARTGLIGAAPAPTPAVHAAPFRTIPAVIYNLLPVELRGLVGGPLGDVAADVPILTDGSATLVHMAAAAPIVPGTWVQDFEVAFGQVVPKPFCSPGPAAHLQLSGPVRLTQRIQVLENGRLVGGFSADGRLGLQPLDFSTGSPVPSGAPYEAVVKEMQQVSVDGVGATLLHTQLQSELPPIGPFRGRLSTRLAVGPDARSDFERTIRCGE